MQVLFFIILFIINRDLVLKMGGLINLCELVISTINRNIIKHGTWAISNLCRGIINIKASLYLILCLHKSLFLFL